MLLSLFCVSINLMIVLVLFSPGCIPLLVQLVQSDKDNDTRKKAAHALHNLVNSQPDEQIRKRELRILKLLEDVRQYIECLKYNMDFQSTTLEPGTSSPEDGEKLEFFPAPNPLRIMFVFQMGTDIQCKRSRI